MLGDNQFGNRRQQIRRKGTLKYASKEYSNPFFDKRKKKQVRLPDFNVQLTWKFKIVSAIILLFISVGIWLFLYSPYFDIREIIINGGGRISTSTISQMAWEQAGDTFYLLKPQRNVFLFNADKFINLLKEKFVFDSLAVDKKIPRTLIINYVEKIYDYIWYENDFYYYCDRNGDVIAEVNLLEVDKKEYPIIENHSMAKIEAGKISVPIKDVIFALSLFRELAEYGGEFPVERFLINEKLNNVDLQIEGGPLVNFDTDTDLLKQVRKLVIVKREKLKDDFNNKIYIDVRIGDNVYYK